MFTKRAKIENPYGSSGAEDRDRTGTVVTYRRILSPVRLPIPQNPHGYRLRDVRGVFKGTGFEDHSILIFDWSCAFDRSISRRPLQDKFMQILG